MFRQNLQLTHLEQKMQAFKAPAGVAAPPTGWIKAVRLALGISLEQLAKRLSVSRQNARSMEQREESGSVTIKSLRKVAHALDMELVYGFVPKDGSLDALIERRAKELAIKIVARTSNTMKLEDQENSQLRLKKAVEERTAIIRYEMPKALWD